MNKVIEKRLSKIRIVLARWFGSKPPKRYDLRIANWLSEAKLSDVMSFSCDLKQVLEECFPKVQRIALVFFMGIGDFYMIAKFLLLLREHFPHIRLDAYVSKSTDVNNNPGVYECLRTFDCVDSIFYYDGYAEKHFWRYNYQDVFNKVSDDTFVIPMLYDWRSLSRVESTCDMYSVPYEKGQNRLPYIPLFPPSTLALEAFERICDNYNEKELVFFQGNTRSSGYTYPYAKELVDKLITKGFYVLSYDDTECVSQNYFQLPKEFSINDTIALLRLLKDESKIYVVNVNSVMNVISAALNIPELVLQIFNDDVSRSYTFDNAFLITPKLVNDFSAKRQYIASPEEFRENKKRRFYYNVDCVIRGLQILMENKPDGK